MYQIRRKSQDDHRQENLPSMNDRDPDRLSAGGWFLALHLSLLSISRYCNSRVQRGIAKTTVRMDGLKQFSIERKEGVEAPIEKHKTTKHKLQNTKTTRGEARY